MKIKGRPGNNEYRGSDTVTIKLDGGGTLESDGASLCQAIAGEMRVARELLEQLAGVLVSDERFVAEYLDQLQAFDLIVQHVDETADLLDRMAGGSNLGEALGQVRLNVMQERLRAALD